MSRTYSLARTPAEFARGKLQFCVRLARDDARSYRETRDRRFSALAREAMRDAREWREELRRAT